MGGDEVTRAPSRSLSLDDEGWWWFFFPAPGVAWWSFSHVLCVATRIEQVLTTTVLGKIFLLCCAFSSPVDTALDARMAYALMNRYVSIPIAVFLYLGFRLQLILFLATTARPMVEAAKQKRWHCHGLIVGLIECCLQWPIIPRFTFGGVAVAWFPLGLQLLHHRRCLTSFVLEILYAPAVIVVGPLIILYGAIASANAVFSDEQFYLADGSGQVRKVRAIVISAISTSFMAVPQLVIQTTVYVLGTIPLSSHQTDIVVCSMSFSILSLLRSAAMILAGWHKIVFTFKRVNRTLDETTFNIILHDVSELAKSGDSIRMRFDQSAPHSLKNLRELSLELAEPSHPHNICFKHDDLEDPKNNNNFLVRTDADNPSREPLPSKEDPHQDTIELGERAASEDASPRDDQEDAALQLFSDSRSHPEDAGDNDDPPPPG